MTHGIYKVTGKREYRGHAPGTVFEAILDPGPEQRAIARGDIVKLGEVTPGLKVGSWVLPDNWPPKPERPAQQRKYGGR